MVRDGQSTGGGFRLEHLVVARFEPVAHFREVDEGAHAALEQRAQPLARGVLVIRAGVFSGEQVSGSTQ